MLELENTVPEKPVIETVAPAKQEYKYQGAIVIPRGMKLFSCNMLSGEVREVEVEKKAMIGFDKKIVENKKAMHKAGDFYLTAINLKNAERKAQKAINELAVELEKRNYGTK